MNDDVHTWRQGVVMEDKVQATIKSPFLSDAIRLVLFSFLLLFLELALIRWLGSNILFLSYFSNFILLGSFFGIGIGFLQPKSSQLHQLAPILLTLLILLVTLFPVHITYTGSGVDNLLVIGSYKKSGLPIWITLPVIFLATAAVMASIAHGMAHLFSRFKPLVSYRLDILGSLAGIISFSILSYFNATPIVWGIVVCIIFALLFFKEWQQGGWLAPLQFGCLFIFLTILTYETITPWDVWSPYYKISLYRNEHSIDVWVNGTPHQRIESIEQRKANEPFYFFPYQYNASPANVLIIGAGTGGDVAIALAHGAKHVDAVEIDPTLYKLGYLYNPNHPYDDPRVHIILNDGRTFLQQTHQLYDMIIFALTDSITLVSGQSSLRLESYIYTTEALLAARQHLKAHGIFSMYGYYSWDKQLWLTDRYANTIKAVFNRNPCLDKFGKDRFFSLALTVNADGNLLQCKTPFSPMSQTYVEPSTDDHPFVYLKYNRIPPLYIITILLIFSLSLLAMKLNAGTLTAIHTNMDLFLMGMAFLLLETKSVICFSLLFGNTWIVNALVFSAILTLIYLAIEVTHYFPRLSPLKLYGLLLICLLVNWMIPSEIFLSMPFLPRFVMASLLTFSPVFLANLIFATRFQDTLNSTAAFGVNMLGAMIGGLLEYTSLITGHRFLLILIVLFYTGAFLIGKYKMQLFEPQLSKSD